MEATTASTFTWKRRTFALHTTHTGYRHWENKVSLYYTQKLLYQLNRDQSLQEKFFADKESVLTDYELTEEEHAAIVTPDIWPSIYFRRERPDPNAFRCNVRVCMARVHSVHA